VPQGLKQAAEKVENCEELHPSRAEARSFFNRLRRGWKPRPFKAGGGQEFFSSLYSRGSDRQ
jgi:hypothetical protein